MARYSGTTGTRPSAPESPDGDYADRPLIEVLFEDGLAHDAVYSGAELTNRTPPEFVVDAVMAMAEIAKWEKVGYTVWVRDDSGFEHPLTPAIRGLRPPV